MGLASVEPASVGLASVGLASVGLADAGVAEGWEPRLATTVTAVPVVTGAPGAGAWSRIAPTSLEAS